LSDSIDINLKALLAREVKGFLNLSSCQKLTAGASQETYRIRIETERGQEQVALRRSVPTLLADSSLGVIGPAVEAKLFQLAAAADIPEPEVLYVLQDTDNLGQGFLMQWLDGETLGHHIVRHSDFAALRPKLAYQCGETLARIHNLDIRSPDLQRVLPVVAPRELIQATWEYYRDLNIPLPMIDYTWRWLLDNMPEASRTTLVHGDFRNGNLMVTPVGINAVLDWELAHIGDPVRDLGWLCVNSWRFGNSELPVGGFGEIDDLLAGYQSVSGVEVSREQLQFWQVFGSFWWAVTCLRMAQSWRTGETPSLERPVIGRRSSEAQMDCVNLLVPGPLDCNDSKIPLSAGTQLPMPAELLESVALFLREELPAQLNAETGFLARVASNSLGIVQREIVYGPSLASNEHGRLTTLLNRGGEIDDLRRELVSKLRSTMDLQQVGLAEHLRHTVAGQLSIDQPKYSGL
jgi:aminoglycoside phosphotransferase (APT) family kinase protein